MKRAATTILLTTVALLPAACSDDTPDLSVQTEPAPAEPAEAASTSHSDPFQVEAERFADLRLLRYRAPGFEALDLDTKKLLYYLYEAALSGRDMIYDQRYGYNLAIRRTLEKILREYPGDRETDDFKALVLYAKRVWFSNGIHHHYANDKFEPGFSFAALTRYVHETPGDFPVRFGQSLDDFLAELRPVIFDPTIDAKLVDKRGGIDVVTASAVNFYEGVTQADVEAFYAARKRVAAEAAPTGRVAAAAAPTAAVDPTPVSHGLNSRLVRGADGAIVEQVWKVGGLYTQAIERIVYWLEQAVTVAENDAQRSALQKLIEYYRSGDLEDWDEYNVAWVADTDSLVDTINGFIEVYNDPVGLRGSYEAVVSFRDEVATRRIDAIAREAQWFEDQSPIMDEHKKADVTGIQGRVITVVVEAGDTSPSTPVGINLPNADWIRAQHGSKSVSLGNIVAARNLTAGEAEREFAWDAAEVERGREHGELLDDLLIDMHEVIGHASGRLNPGVGTAAQTLKNYASTLEEGRADLVALYYMLDPKLVEIGVLPSVDAGRIGYDRFIRNGLMQQLWRIEPGADIEEDHMRNRQLIAAWAYEEGRAQAGAAGEGGRAQDVIERRTRDGKTYFVINDYAALREIFGRQLRELQRIKSEGDFEAIRDLVETYAVKVDPVLHAEVRDRYAALDIPPYSGFINPRLVPVEQGGEIVDVRIEYPEDFTGQMLEYAERYSFLPTWQ